MCTLIIATRCAPDVPLFVVANRDESLVRPSSPPDLREIEGVRVLAPRDEQSGGSWLGLNEGGVVVAITNRFQVERRAEHRSRGELVWSALAAPSVEDALAKTRSISARDYGGFHLLVADRERAEVIWSDGETLHEKSLRPGYYALSERSFGAGESARLTRLKLRLPQGRVLDAEVRQELVGWMAERDAQHPFESTCLHMPEIGYGTRSSTLMELGERVRFEHADGPPCETTYRPYTAQLRELGLVAG